MTELYSKKCVFKNENNKNVYYEFYLVSDYEEGFIASCSYCVKCRVEDWDEDDFAIYRDIVIQFNGDIQDFDFGTWGLAKYSSNFDFEFEANYKKGCHTVNETYSKEFIDMLIEETRQHFKDSLVFINEKEQDVLMIFFDIIDTAKNGVKENKTLEEIIQDTQKEISWMGFQFEKDIDCVTKLSQGLTLRDIINISEHYVRRILRQEENFQIKINLFQLKTLEYALQTFEPYYTRKAKMNNK